MKVACASIVLLLVGSTLHADPLTCNMNGYKAAPGLAATLANDALTVTWDGDRNQELRLRFGALRRHADHSGAGGPQSGGRTPGASWPPTSRRTSASCPACGA